MYVTLSSQVGELPLFGRPLYPEVAWYVRRLSTRHVILAKVFIHHNALPFVQSGRQICFSAGMKNAYPTLLPTFLYWLIVLYCRCVSICFNVTVFVAIFRRVITVPIS